MSTEVPVPSSMYPSLISFFQKNRLKKTLKFFKKEVSFRKEKNIYLADLLEIFTTYKQQNPISTYKHVVPPIPPGEGKKSKINKKRKLEIDAEKKKIKKGKKGKEGEEKEQKTEEEIKIEEKEEPPKKKKKKEEKEKVEEVIKVEVKMEKEKQEPKKKKKKKSCKRRNL